MIRQLTADQMTAVRAARKVIETGDAQGDPATTDLGVRRVHVHEKNAWMLRSHLG